MVEPEQLIHGLFRAHRRRIHAENHRKSRVRCRRQQRQVSVEGNVIDVFLGTCVGFFFFLACFASSTCILLLLLLNPSNNEKFCPIYFFCRLICGEARLSLTPSSLLTVNTAFNKYQAEVRLQQDGVSLSSHDSGINGLLSRNRTG